MISISLYLAGTPMLVEHLTERTSSGLKSRPSSLVNTHSNAERMESERTCQFALDTIIDEQRPVVADLLLRQVVVRLVCVLRERAKTVVY